MRIIVSSNAEQYRVVEITGAPNGSFIRERILSKMCVPDNSFSRYSIYQSEIGVYALGGALSDSGLFDICLQYGDPSGSLRRYYRTGNEREKERKAEAQRPRWDFQNNLRVTVIKGLPSRDLAWRAV
ncbi:hypothetical protein EV368DRAFT_63529 [Lentinula lateritia]|nr:hypothetical protein EV368DRAFT_63529 [Lentinula lateritia]